MFHPWNLGAGEAGFSMVLQMLRRVSSIGISCLSFKWIMVDHSFARFRDSTYEKKSSSVRPT